MIFNIRAKFNVIFNKINKNRLYLFIVIYSTLFICLYVFRNFLFRGKLYIYTDIGNDTINVYWPCFNLINNSLRKFGQIPFWSFNLGIGTNIFSLGSLFTDPFNWIYIFVKANKIPNLIIYTIIIRIILSGIIMYTFMNKLNISKYTSLIASLIYAFNGYVMLWGQHYQFCTFALIIPLTLWTYEIWFQDGQWLFFVCSIAFCSAISPYFLFMLSILLFIYALFRYLELHIFKLNEFSIYFLKTICFYFLGIFVGGIFFFPLCYALLTSPRVGGQLLNLNIFSLNDIQYYVTAVSRIFSNDFLGTGINYYGTANYYESPSLYCSLSTIILIPQIVSIKNIKNKIIYIVQIIIMAIFIIFPFFAAMFNYFSIVEYRWTIIVIVIEIIISGRALDNILEQKKIDIKLLISTVYFMISILTIAILIGKLNFNWNSEIFSTILDKLKYTAIFMIIYSFVFYLITIDKIKKIGKVLFFILLCIEIGYSSNVTTNFKRTNLTYNYLSENQGYFDATEKALKYIQENDTSFYRIDKSYDSVFLDDSLIQDYKGIKCYDSLNQPNFIKFLKENGIPFKILNSTNYITGLDDEYELQSLLGVKYYLNKNGQQKPFGFELLNSISGIDIYINNNYLPLGYTYDSIISYDKFSKMTYVEKENTLLESFVSNDKYDLGKFKEKDSFDNVYNSVQLNSNDVKASNVINVINNNVSKFFVKANSNECSMKIPIKSYGDYFRLTSNVYSNEDTAIYISWKDKNGVYNDNNQKKLIINKGKGEYKTYFYGKNINELTIRFENINEKMAFSEFKIDELNISEYTNKIQKLSESTLNIDKSTDTYIHGNIKLDKDKFLVMSIPFDKGWKIKVDGKDSTLKCVNAGLSGLELNKGYHSIELKYTPPLLIEGLICTIIGIIVIITLKFLYYIRTRKL